MVRYHFFHQRSIKDSFNSHYSLDSFSTHQLEDLQFVQKLESLSAELEVQERLGGALEESGFGYSHKIEDLVVQLNQQS